MVVKPSAPRPLRLRRHTLVVVVALLGVLLSLAGYHWALKTEQDALAAEFRRQVEARHALTREIIGSFESSLFGLSILFAGSDHVTREEFADAARRMEARYPAIAALEWVPVVPAAQRDEVETAAKRELAAPFQFQVPGADGGMTRAPAVPEHFPILYVEPLPGNERALGYDLAFGPTSHELELARRTGTLVVSGSVSLLQEPRPNRHSIIFIWPVFAAGDQNRCLGFVQGIFRLDDMLGSDPGDNAAKILDVLFLDLDANDASRRALFYGAASGAEAIPAEAELRAGLHHAARLKVGNRTWLALYRPSAAWRESQSSLMPWGPLLSGLLVTGLLAGLIHTLSRRTVTIAQEVAERTAELQESRRQLESIVQTVPGMVFRCAADQATRVLYASDGTATLTGHPAADFVAGRVHLRDLIHPEDLNRVRRATRDALQAKAPFEMEYRIRHRDGTEKWVLSRGRGIHDAQGRLRFFEGLAIDITDRKQAEADKLVMERRLFEGQKLESLGLLAGGLAHDFNNLLTTIIGNASLARLEAAPGSAVDKNLGQIELASQHAADLCQQMLAYAGKGRLVVEPVDLSALIAAMQPLLQASVSRSASLRLQLARGLPAINGDASQLRQIALNLVTNASDALGDEAGAIRIATALESITAEELAACSTGTDLPAGRYVVLTVSDGGRGMTPATLARIFDPFFTTKFAGRGLGLAAVLGIVRSHGGALHVASQPGQGSTFRLMLPPLPDQPAPAVAIPAEAKPTVLIVDDDEPVCMVTSELLRTMQFEAVSAHSGEEALAIFKADPARFTLVMLDVVMPGMGGFELMARLRALQPDLRVLIMSGHAGHARLDAMTTDPRLACVSKPFHRARLEDILRDLLKT